MALIFGYKLGTKVTAKCSEWRSSEKAPRSVDANDVIALTVITIHVHVNGRCPYNHVTELFIAFSTCDTPIFCHICF